MIGLLPWQGEVWGHVVPWLRQTRVPHGLLLHGPSGLGKAAFAAFLARSLLCEQPGDDFRACGHCRGCRLFEAGSHPDAMLINVQENRREIVVDQVRELGRFTALRSARGGYKVGVITPAEHMNRNAANSVLKTLEEPPAGTVLLLVSHAPALLPATVRSRCQMLHFRRPAGERVIPWLEEHLPPGNDAQLLLRLANGSPERALELGQGGAVEQRDRVLDDIRGLVQGVADPVTAAADWLRMGTQPVVYWVHDLICDLVRMKHGAAGADLVNGDVQALLRPLSQRLDFGLLFDLLDKCLRARSTSERRQNLNEQCLLEDIAITWAWPGQAAPSRAYGGR